jgi:hypothetical protein
MQPGNARWHIRVNVYSARISDPRTTSQCEQSLVRRVNEILPSESDLHSAIRVPIGFPHLVREESSTVCQLPRRILTSLFLFCVGIGEKSPQAVVLIEGCGWGRVTFSFHARHITPSAMSEEIPVEMWNLGRHCGDWAGGTLDERCACRMKLTPCDDI